MSRKELLENTIKYLKELPNEKISEVHDFVEYLYQKHEEYILKTGIQKLETESGSFQFLKNQEELYTVNNIKEKYNEKGWYCFTAFSVYYLSGNKLRPALILVVNKNDVVVSFITTNESLKTETDISIQSSPKNGLKSNSIVLLNKIATLEKSLVLGKIGVLAAKEIREVNQMLIEIFKINYAE